MNFSRKSQAAMEFLMTYGWAILVVLVAIGALAYFGVLSPDRFLPAKCQLPAGIACTDFSIKAGATPITGTVNIILRNGLGFDVSIDRTGAKSDPKEGVYVEGCTTPAITKDLANGVQDSFAVSGCTLTSGSKYSGPVNVTYTNQDSGLVHTVQGTITGRVE